jgi:hypothetical protein
LEIERRAATEPAAPMTLSIRAEPDGTSTYVYEVDADWPKPRAEGASNNAKSIGLRFGPQGY